MTRPSSPSSCSGLRTSTTSAPSARSIAACSRKLPCKARTPIFTVRLYGAMLDFLAVGDVMLDVFTGAAPADAVHAAVRVRGGGSALNAAVWAASEGAHAGVIGRIGSDSAALMVRSELAEAGIEARLAVDR